MLLHEDNRLAEAEPLLRQALDKRRRVLGDEHEQTLSTGNNLAMVLMAAGKLGEAERLFRDVLDQQRRLLGDEHPHTLNAVNNLGMLLFRQGKLDDAEPLLREAMQRLQRTTPDHPNTMSAMVNVGSLLLQQGRVAEAEPLIRQALEKQRPVLGDEHPRTLMSQRLVATILSAQSKPREAVELLTSIEPAARKAFTGTSAFQLARVLIGLGSARANLATDADAFAVAETNLLEAQAILSAAATPLLKDRRDAAQAFIDLYAAWQRVAPGASHQEQSAVWKAKLDTLKE